MLIRRILMNAQDGSPGSGVATSTPATPATAEPVAQAPQPVPAQGSQIDVAAITRSIAESVTKTVSDSVHATLRRAGVLNKPTPPGDTPATAVQATAPAVDPMRMRALDRALNRAGYSANLDDRAYQRVERAFSEEAPDDADGWVSGYFDGMGIKRTTSAPVTAAPTTTTIATSTAAPAATPPSVPQTPPASDRGSPPPATVPLEERKLQEMSEADRQEYLSRHGARKYSEKLARDLVGSKVF